MYSNISCSQNFEEGMENLTRKLIISKSGFYRMIRMNVLKTERPYGWNDFQLLYITFGKAYYYINGEKLVANEGDMIIYRPGEEQKYEYFGSDKTEVFWVHFTGSEARNLVNRYIPEGKNLFFVGHKPELEGVFRQIIAELHLCRANYEELLPLYLMQILISVDRYLKEDDIADEKMFSEIERAAIYFNENYNLPISVSGFAETLHMSPCWFIRKFKELFGVTPLKYILEQRMLNAENLLKTTKYNVTEVSEAVGYDNPLYFSRLFTKYVGVSPTEYKKNFQSKSK